MDLKLSASDTMHSVVMYADAFKSINEQLKLTIQAQSDSFNTMIENASKSMNEAIEQSARDMDAMLKSQLHSFYANSYEIDLLKYSSGGRIVKMMLRDGRIVEKTILELSDYFAKFCNVIRKVSRDVIKIKKEAFQKIRAIFNKIIKKITALTATKSTKYQLTTAQQKTFTIPPIKLFTQTITRYTHSLSRP